MAPITSRTGVALAILVSAAAPLAAQRNAESPTQSAFRELKPRIETEARIRVVVNTYPYEVRNPRVEGDTLYGRGATGDVRYALSQVSEIATWNGTKMKQGALWGGLGMFVFAAAVGEFCLNDPQCEYHERPGPILGIAVGAGAVGTVVGGLIGASMRDWKPIYSAPSPGINVFPVHRGFGLALSLPVQLR